jgi:hypothetical protein
MIETEVVKYSFYTYYVIKGTQIFHREDGPAVESENGLKEWRINGKLHREDGPAVIYSDGTKKWYLNGELHRENGPAKEYGTGKKEWYLYGEYFDSKELWFRALPSKEKQLKALYSEYFIRG